MIAERIRLIKLNELGCDICGVLSSMVLCKRVVIGQNRIPRYDRALSME